MVQFLLSLVFHPFTKLISQTSAWIKVGILPLFVFLMGAQVFGQHVDTWYTADRAVNAVPLPNNVSLNLYTPYPIGDGIPGTAWHDVIEFNPLNQIAIPHPNPRNYNQP